MENKHAEALPKGRLLLFDRDPAKRDHFRKYVEGQAWRELTDTERADRLLALLRAKRLEARQTDTASKMPQAGGDFLMRKHDRPLAESIEPQRRLVEHPPVAANNPVAVTRPSALVHPFSAHYHLRREDEDRS